MSDLKYSVETFRQAGLEAKWMKTRGGKPYIAVRNPNAKNAHQRDKWWAVDKSMFEKMQQIGVVEAFDQITLLGDIFSI